jgi:hypothetical protein
VLGIIVALALGAYLAFGQAGHKVARAKAAPTPVAVSVAKPKHAGPAAGSAPAKTPAPASVRLAISTNGRSSWLELRRGSATGTVLFTGELAPGRILHVSGKRLWGRFGAAGNLTITANGKPVALLGTYEHLFVAAKR